MRACFNAGGRRPASLSRARVTGPGGAETISSEWRSGENYV